MAEPINMKTLGGLTYNANLVESAKKNQDGTFTISFKTGETLTYPEQKPLKPKLSGLERNKYDYEKEKWVPTGDFELANRNNPKAVTGETFEPIKKYYKSDETVPRNAKVDLSIKEDTFYDDTYFNITNVMGATFTSSDKTVTHVTLKNSSGTKIDLASNDSSYYADSVKIIGGANNSVILDDEDKANINNKLIEGRGTAAQKDYE